MFMLSDSYSHIVRRNNCPLGFENVITLPAKYFPLFTFQKRISAHVPSLERKMRVLCVMWFVLAVKS